VASYLINRGSDLDPETADVILRTLGRSDNSATDLVLERIDPFNGPLFVTRDMEAIGLQSTFIGGMFYLGAPNLIAGAYHARQFKDRRFHPARFLFPDHSL
jgi:hypothetical protein